MKAKSALKPLKRIFCCCCAVSSDEKEVFARPVRSPNFDGTADTCVGGRRSGHDDEFEGGGCGIAIENHNIINNNESDSGLQLIPEFDLQNSVSEFSQELGTNTDFSARERHNHGSQGLDSIMNHETVASPCP
ncbi:uncharacterized protein DFL_005339 [Arthrobotrys flagrans]|uniref:Uncharacterized protein n=1 Tax=Arthrobotrys flagrans TaxID=97331 RepID=A0A437A7C6_ARTFL|nr:hypothetical protein DFL_005339 [Arthrobotrys flagrans]